MKKKLTEAIIVFLAALTVYSAAFFCLSENREIAVPQLFITDIYLCLLASVVIMAVCLRASLKRTLYSYRNILYIGGILYASLQLAVLTGYFVSSAFHKENLTTRGVFRFLTGFPRDFSYFAVPVLLILSLLICISNIALIRHEGFRIKNLLGFLLGGFYIGSTAALYVLFDVIDKNMPDTTAGTILNTFIPLCLLLILCYFECIFAGFAVMSAMAFRHIPEYNKDYIIILGCSISKKGGLLPLLKGRTNRAVRFAWDQEIATGKKVLYVPSGGQGPGEIMSEGSAMELYLLSHGAESDEVYPEKMSRNTEENLKFSGEIIRKMNPDAKIAFATTNYHVFRSGLLAKNAGLDAEGIASRTKWYFWPNGFVREFFAVLSMHKRVHIMVSAACTAVCAALALTAYFCNLL